MSNSSTQTHKDDATDASPTNQSTESPAQVLDGVQIAETETGNRYTITIDNDEVTVASLDGEDVRQPTPREFDRWLKHGEFYVPEYSPAHEVHDAIEALAEVTEK